MIIRDDRDSRNFRHKLLKYWAQSFLLGTPEVIVGFRNSVGTVADVKSYQTAELPGMVSATGEWDAGFALDFTHRHVRQCSLPADFLSCYRFLRFLKDTISKSHSKPSDQRRVWRVRMKPRQGFELEEVGEGEMATVSNGEDRVGFIPTSFFMRRSAAS